MHNTFMTPVFLFSEFKLICLQFVHMHWTKNIQLTVDTTEFQQAASNHDKDGANSGNIGYESHNTLKSK